MLQVYLPKSSDYWRIVERIARKYTQGTLIAWEDALQSAHAKVCQETQKGKFQQDNVEKFQHWAVKVAQREIIDLVRKAKRWQLRCTSLDEDVPGTNGLHLWETIPDQLNLMDLLERDDLILRTIDAIAEIEQHYPHKKFLALWQGKVHGKNQAQLASEIGISQSEVSQRLQELKKYIIKFLGLLQPENIQREQLTARLSKDVTHYSNGSDNF